MRLLSVVSVRLAVRSNKAATSLGNTKTLLVVKERGATDKAFAKPLVKYSICVVSLRI